MIKFNFTDLKNLKLRNLKIKTVESEKIALVVSSALFALGLIFLLVRGFNLGVDFESGISDTVAIGRENVKIDEVRSALSSLNVRVQRSGDDSDSTFIIRTSAKDNEEKEKKEADIMSALNTYFSGTDVKSISSSFIGAKFSSSLITTSLSAIAVALIGILIYIWFRFQFSFSVAAVLTLLHDVLLLLSFIAVFRIEISSITIAAILTIIGYSINNTIVIFDRIKENIVLGSKSLDDTVNLSINQSLSRTLFSSLTTLVVIVPMGLLVTNHDIKMFSLVLSTGIVIGIYSSMFVGANILRVLSRIKKQIFNPMLIASSK